MTECDDIPRRGIRCWDQWFDGRMHTIETRQYGCDPEVFRNRAKVAARRRGYRIETSKAEDRPVIYLKRK